MDVGLQRSKSFVFFVCNQFVPAFVGQMFFILVSKVHLRENFPYFLLLFTFKAGFSSEINGN